MFTFYALQICGNLHLPLSFSIIFFFAAFFYMCFQDSNAATRALDGSFCGVVWFFVCWYVWILWKKRREEPSIPTFADEKEQTVANDLLSSERVEIRSSWFDRLMSLSGQGRQDDIEMTGV
jgi:amino acid permease